MPENYGNVRDEYDALRESAALLDFSPAGKLEVSGKNAVQFVNGLVTNDVKALQVGEGVLAAFLNVQGKVVALGRFYQTGTGLLIETEPERREVIFKNLSRFVPAGDFSVNDASGNYALLSLQGPRAALLLASFAGGPVEIETEYRLVEREVEGFKLLIASHWRCGGTGYDLFIPTGAKEPVWQRLIDEGARPAGRAAFEVARVEAGIPREGADVTESNILLEAGLEKAVSYTKGCYLGQEVIARIHWRGQPAKQLRGLLVEAAQPPGPGTELHSAEGKKIGEITSSVRSWALDRVIALGYVHRYYLTPGTAFTLKSGGAEVGRATVAELPFVQPQPQSNPNQHE